MRNPYPPAHNSTSWVTPVIGDTVAYEGCLYEVWFSQGNTYSITKLGTDPFEICKTFKVIITINAKKGTMTWKVKHHQILNSNDGQWCTIDNPPVIATNSMKMILGD